MGLQSQTLLNDCACTHTHKTRTYCIEHETLQCYMSGWLEGSLGENGYMCMYGGVPLVST